MISLDMCQSGEIPVVPLVNSLQAQKVSRNARSSGRPLALPSECGGVVRERMDGALTTIHVMNKYVMLSNGSCELEIGVGDGARGIVAANDCLLHVLWKRGTPEKRIQFARWLVPDKEHPSHAWAGGIRGPDGCRWCVDQLP